MGKIIFSIGSSIIILFATYLYTDSAFEIVKGCRYSSENSQGWSPRVPDCTDIHAFDFETTGITWLLSFVAVTGLLLFIWRKKG